ncbi:GGDEF domain-containing protein [Rhizobium sp. BK376]|uniref:GGDEF domain-containing protein n=1 Tax=Rhizobium sp. BK376 TaxID=2512149 RepID=UPI00105145D0|nr:GGDEF domain-containing protein [Rhizobium sp. BK376]TCR92869.1 diguanylate cyclase (GGDEF)-like protein [Rhizobium sp. BK376]
MFSIATGLTIWCTEALTLAFTLFLAWRYDRQSPNYLMWSAGFAVGAIGFAMVAARGFIPNILSIEIGNAITLLGESAWIAGFRQMDKRKLQLTALLPPLIWTAGVCLPWVASNFTNRVALYDLSSAVGATLLVMVVLPHGEHREQSRIHLSFIFLTLACVNFVSALAIVIMGFSDEVAAICRAISALSSALMITLAIAFTGRLLMERSERRWHALSITDYLTGALNRRGLQDGFRQMTGDSADGSRKIAALLFDLDHFKSINDRHGHQAGDHVLSEFARIAKRFIPRDGIFGRMGGEEFIGFIVVDDQTEAEVIAELIRADFCRVPLLAGAALIPASVSGGIAILPIAEAAWDNLVSAADRALYAAKKAGRNCTVVFGEEEAANATNSPPDPNGGELVPTLDDQIHALRRMGTLSRM